MLRQFPLTWILEYRDHSGTILNKRIASGCLYFQVEKGIRQSFLLYPEISLSGSKILRLKPAGYLYPENLTTKIGGTFDWQLGFESHLVMEISKYINPAIINLERLFYEIDQTANHENHWIIDDEIILQNLLIGDFRVYDIRKKRERDVEIIIPEGEWFSVNLTNNNLQSASDSEPTVVSLYTGFHQFVNENGMVLEISLQGDGEYEYIIY